ncbi:DEAD/DEAH box helicase [Sphingomonas colocasiae]|uniref:DEAD/DEAH box helicase n=1 Tax=Sphingomonas colocasiae TaxID=1848973 RepID=A0ABS7PSH2_9SPHN|nr:DEAD/DEAH box helicase [Sphingomonas colocasiae]MBY8824285.1 DEAD/DEAH box helicase [Sphingomonas colocasiae]
MFDPVTSALIATSPPLSGLDLEALPKQLTQAFAEIVSARIRMRQAHAAEISEDLRETLIRVRRLAAAHEAFVAILPDRENRAAAAFVAGSAHQACLLARPRGEIARSFVNETSVAEEVSATLLFLVAESHADAAEASKQIQDDAPQSTAVEKALLTSIKMLATGELRAIVQSALPEIIDAEDSMAVAIDALRLELLKGVKHIALRLRNKVDIDPTVGGVQPATAFFERVKALSVSEIDGIFDDGRNVVSLFPGLIHIANLLLAVERDLISSALTRVPTPGGVTEDAWWQIIRRMAENRPYLWRNHREAIDKGYLEQGISSAISFPTGGGKSTLAELKIATALLRGQKVIFLAPTHALVDQTTKALQKTFNTFNFDIIGDVDEEMSFDSLLILPEATVTTPERCLMLMSAQPEAFADLGLVVFDECHLLHPRDDDRSRRSVDAMLAVLNLVRIAPHADLLLLSAMMKNADEIAGWIGEMTGRPCLSLNLAWKPTRQVRGSVVYPAKRISELNEALRTARAANREPKNAPRAVTRGLTAQPFGFFGLLQTWATQERSDYALLPLLPDEHSLSTGRTKGGNWYLTPNGNQTAARIAAAAAAAGLKTLVFVQTVVLAESSTSDFRNLLNVPAIELEEAEKELYRLAAEEMGGEAHCYLDLEANGTFAGGAASHHALLLREERHLHESLFKRPGGVGVLFATSTLAQGMNLPSEVVIIAGDNRFDPDADRMAQLEAHEILNAAGRAGRAGERSNGFVLVVPSKVVEFDDEQNLINAHWLTLQSIFSQSDQCLDIDDPSTVLLDHVHAGASDKGMPAYFVSRLPPADDDGGDTSIRSILGNSFAAFRARKRGDTEWIESRIAAAFAARQAMQSSDGEQWLDRVSGLTGVSTKLLAELAELVDGLPPELDSVAFMILIFEWLAKRPESLLDLVRPENVEAFFGKTYSDLTTDGEKGAFALPVLHSMLLQWMAGAPLNEIEKRYPEGGDPKRCKRARHFVLKLVPDLAFIAGLPALILTARSAKDEDDSPIPSVVATLGRAVREGCDSPASLAARSILGLSVSRVASRAEFEKWLPHLPPGDPHEDFDATRERVRNAQLVAGLDDD